MGMLAHVGEAACGKRKAVIFQGMVQSRGGFTIISSETPCLRPVTTPPLFEIQLFSMNSVGQWLKTEI